MSNLSTIAELHRTALYDRAALCSLPTDPLLRGVLREFHAQQVRECLAALDRHAASLPCMEEREAARRAAKDVRSDQASLGSSAPAR